MSDFIVGKDKVQVWLNNGSSVEISYSEDDVTVSLVNKQQGSFAELSMSSGDADKLLKALLIVLLFAHGDG